MSELPSDLLLAWYRTMILIRRFEEKLVKLTKMGQSFGHYHLYIGQETTGVPALSLLDANDYVFTTHRNHGHLLARGADARRLLAEILGKATGYSKGKSGSLHLAVRELGVPVTSALVGGVLPLATGAGLAIRQLRGRQVSLCLFGDGAIEEGAFFECVNMAALWKLPVIYLCENNSLDAPGASAGEYPSSTLAAPDLPALVRPFGIPGTRVDATDARAVYTAVGEAVDRARAGGGPTFVEAYGIRWPGSRPLWPELLTGETDLAMAWDETRIPDEYGDWHRRHDCLLRFTRELLAEGVMSSPRVQALDEQVKEEIAGAVEFALNSPYPDPATATEDMFA